MFLYWFWFIFVQFGLFLSLLHKVKKLEFFEPVPSNTKVFCVVYDYGKKRKLGLAMRFSEIIKLNLGGKYHTLPCSLKHFRIFVV